MLGNAGAMAQRLSGRGYRVSTDGNGAHPEIFRHQGWKPRLARGLAVQAYSALGSQRLRPPLIAPLCSSLGSKMQSIAFTAEGLHLALYFAFNRGIRDQWAH